MILDFESIRGFKRAKDRESGWDASQRTNPKLQFLDSKLVLVLLFPGTHQLLTSYADRFGLLCLSLLDCLNVGVLALALLFSPGL
eukprot:m.26814 g.26814  ORF g.26814 m.26814 type:complete len:85 (+) comp4669_c0_seq1:102-356(+)